MKKKQQTYQKQMKQARELRDKLKPVQYVSTETDAIGARFDDVNGRLEVIK
jgi:hypothetical protein